VDAGLIDQRMTLVANARMYALDAAVAAAWRVLFAAVGEQAGVALEPIEHPPPRPLSELWQRDDLGSAFICGYPWAIWATAAGERRPVALAAPIPSNPRGVGRPLYWSDVVVRADAPFERIEDLFGRRMAWTVPDSQSGHQALRTMLAERAHGGALFASMVGPLVTPRRVVDAVLAGDADGGPLDSYWHDLLRRHEPDVASRLRIVGRTPPTPMPLLVASAASDAAQRERLRAAWLAVAARPDLASLRETLQIDGFAPVDARAYDLLAQRAREADRLGYARLQ
jgi:ABC-type phosphate/phosphonate transport system substrate-binding protein